MSGGQFFSALEMETVLEKTSAFLGQEQVTDSNKWLQLLKSD